MEDLKIGDKVQTSLGEAIILDIQEEYLILFSDSKFIKANQYQEKNNKIVWQNGEYHNCFSDLVTELVPII